MRIFLDANILVSVLNKEYPRFIHTSRILSLADRSNFELFTSPICLAIAFYFSEKKSGTKKAKDKMRILCDKLSITKVDEKATDDALQNKSVNDLEDGLEYYSAIEAGCTTIITENIKDFHFSKVDVFDGEGFLNKIKVR